MHSLETALVRGQKGLTEYEAKRLLADFGIPITRESLAPDPGSAAAAAERIGFPVVLKVTGANLHHKTEVGGVALNLKSPEEVRREGRTLLTIPGCEALLVQEMVRGNRELVCGMIRDAHLGPCVMFGVGGIFAEVLDDTVFRVAPLRGEEALDMIGEIRSAKLLGPFRGQSPVDRAALGAILVALGEIAMRFEKIRAIDINPLKVRPDGSLVAVDALIAIAENGPEAAPASLPSVPPGEGNDRPFAVDRTA